MLCADTLKVTTKHLRNTTRIKTKMGVKPTLYALTEKRPSNMNDNLFVTKRNGEKESIDLEKIHKVVTWAAKGLSNVSVSQVEIKAQIQFFDGINTSEILSLIHI